MDPIITKQKFGKVSYKTESDFTLNDSFVVKICKLLPLPSNTSISIIHYFHEDNTIGEVIYCSDNKIFIQPGSYKETDYGIFNNGLMFKIISGNKPDNILRIEYCDTNKNSVSEKNNPVFLFLLKLSSGQEKNFAVAFQTKTNLSKNYFDELNEFSVNWFKLLLLNGYQEFRFLFEFSNEAMFICRNARIIDINFSCKKLFGYQSAENLPSDVVFDYCSQDERVFLKKILQQAEYKQHSFNRFETIGVNRNGEQIDLLVSISPLNINGKNSNLVFVQDFTKRNRIENELLINYERLSTLVDLLPDMVAIKDSNNRWLIMNKTFREFYGLGETAYANKYDADLIKTNNEFGKQYNNYFVLDEKVIKTQVSERCEERKINKDYEIIVDFLRKPVLNENKELKYLFIFGREITDRIKIENEIQKYRTKLEELVEEKTREQIKIIKALNEEINKRKKNDLITKYHNEFTVNVIKAESTKSALIIWGKYLAKIFSVTDWLLVRKQEKTSVIIYRPSNISINEDVINKILVSKNLNNWIVDLEKKRIRIYNKNLELLLSQIETEDYHTYRFVGIPPINHEFTTEIKYVCGAMKNHLFSVIKNDVARKTIEINEKKWSNLYENLPGGSIVLNQKYLIEDLNDYTSKITGFLKEELLGQDLSKIMDIQALSNRKKNDILKIIPDHNNLNILTSDNRKVPVITNIKSTRIFNKDYFLLNFQDISLQKSVELKLDKINRCLLELDENSLQNFEKLVGLLKDILNTDVVLYLRISENQKWVGNKIFQANCELYEMLEKLTGKLDTAISDIHILTPRQTKLLVEKGYNFKSVFIKTVKTRNIVSGYLFALNKSDYELHPNDFRFWNIIITALATEESRYLMNEEYKKYKENLELDYSQKTEELKNTNQLLSKEISEKDKIKTVLANGYTELQKLFDNIPLCLITIISENKKIFEINSEAASLLKSKRENLIGQRIDQYLQGSENINIDDIISTALLSDELLPVKIFIRKTEYELELKATEQIYFGQKVIVLFIKDVSDQQKMERENDQNKTDYKLLIENASDLFFRVNENGIIKYINKNVYNLLGYSQEEIIGKSFDFIIEKKYRSKTKSFYLNQLKNRIKNTYFEMPVLSKKGNLIWLGQNVQLIKDEKKDRFEFQAISRDVSRRVYAEQALRVSEIRFRTLAQNIPNVAVYGINEEKNIIFWNTATEKMYGFYAQEVLGENIVELLGKNDQNYFTEIENIFEGKLFPSKEYEFVKKNKKPITVISNKLLLRSYFGRKEIYFIDVDLTQRKEIENELKKAKIFAEQMNRTKTNFLTNVTHELKTPLNGIIGYSQILSKDPALNRIQKEAIDIIERSGNHLLNIIEDILDLSKIESKKIKLYKKVFDVKMMVISIAGSVRLLANNKNLRFLFNYDERIPRFIYSDEKRLSQVLYNLLSNAVKYTKEGTISFSIELIDKKIRFQVKDTGIGITKDDIRKIFNPFVQTEDSKNKNAGTGIGLTISKRLVNLFGSKLKVESEIDKGSVFWFDILIEDSVTGATDGLKKNIVINTKIMNQDILNLLKQDYYTCDTNIDKGNYDILLADQFFYKTNQLLLENMNNLIVINYGDKSENKFSKQQNYYKDLCNRIDTLYKSYRINLSDTSEPSGGKNYKDSEIIILKSILEMIRTGDIAETINLINKYKNAWQNMAVEFNHLENLLNEFDVQNFIEYLKKITKSL